MTNAILRQQNFGVEIELTGITRQEAAKVIANYYGTTSQYIGSYYKTWGAKDSKGRTWKAMSDGSIHTQKKVHGETCSANSDYSCEVVTPILQYEDMEDLQNIVRALRKAGAFANSSCGIHVHVDGANHTPESLYRLMALTVGRQELFYEALQIGSRANTWCKPMNKKLVKAVKRDPVKTESHLERMWYSRLNDGYSGGIDHSHYNSTRYHGINLHAFFTKGTVEFRLFNGTTHAGKIKAYVQFCLAMSAWAITDDGMEFRFTKTTNMNQEQKYNAMKRLLKRRLGLTGTEFRTCREHLMSAFAA